MSKLLRGEHIAPLPSMPQGIEYEEIDPFAKGTPRRVVAPSAPLRRSPRGDAGLDTEVLAGEMVCLFDQGKDGWAWGQRVYDAYVGYLPVAALGEVDPAPTHRVNVRRTFVYPEPEMKTPPVRVLTLGCEVTVVGTAETRGLPYALIAGGGAVVASHISKLDKVVTDWVGVAERLIGTPYLWGGTTADGIDCSGLVQLSLRMAGRRIWRDSDQQEKAVGKVLEGRLPLAEGRNLPPDLIRGDLLFWPGHVAIMQDDRQLLHASGYFMEVVSEPAGKVIERVARIGTALRTVKRL